MDETLLTRLAFSQIKNINASLAEQLLSRIGSEDEFFSMESDRLGVVGGLPDNLTDADYRSKLLGLAKDEEKFIIANGIGVKYFRDEDYPSRLLNCDDAPAMLYTLGDADFESRHMIAIVGTRRATHYGIDATTRIVHELAEALDNPVIVSGLAYGIDVAAHKAALECGLPTVAVLANPLNTIYPADHRGVAVQIVREGGALVTEYATCNDVHKTNFVARNRIIAGMTDATVVVESDTKGGSLITAGMALDYGREVFAVPGRITDKYSRGALDLVAADKAHIYTSIDHFLDVMGWEAKQTEGAQMELALEMSSHEKLVYDFLTQNPGSTVNAIMMGTSLSQGVLKDILFTMEMKDLVMSMAGGRYSAL